MKFFNLKNIGLLTLIVIALLLPVGISDYWQYVLTIAFFYAIMAASWNLLGGYTGQSALEEFNRSSPGVRSPDARQSFKRRAATSGQVRL